MFKGGKAAGNDSVISGLLKTVEKPQYLKLKRFILKIWIKEATSRTRNISEHFLSYMTL